MRNNAGKYFLFYDKFYQTSVFYLFKPHLDLSIHQSTNYAGLKGLCSCGNFEVEKCFLEDDRVTAT